MLTSLHPKLKINAKSIIIIYRCTYSYVSAREAFAKDENVRWENVGLDSFWETQNENERRKDEKKEKE